jgi:hypothetical protein
MSDPGRIKGWQWVLWEVVQFFCIWGAIAAYGSMNRGLPNVRIAQMRDTILG